MKTLLSSVFLAVAAAVAAPSAASAQSILETYTFSPNAVIPDNSSSGLALQQTIGSAIHDITSVSVALTISGGFNGDYYAYLTHTDPFSGTVGFAVLLNRVGRTDSNSFGYTDGGFSNVTFSAMLGLPDIHGYQSTQNPGGGPLVSGMWAPDGRNVDPANALDTTPRTALLSSFQNLDANGAWTLYIADVAPAGQGTLVSWSLSIVGVPEPSTWAAGALVLGALGWHQRRRLALLRRRA